MTADFHTHAVPERGPALVSTEAEAFPDAARLQLDAGREIYYSLELHPWKIPADFTVPPELWFARASQAAAIGETGLDHLRGAPWQVQCRAFDFALGYAHQQHLPVVIHAVRSQSEVCAMVRHYPGLRVLIHGFSGGAKKLETYFSEGYWVSMLPATAARTEISGVLARYPDQCALESDEKYGILEDGPAIPGFPEEKIRQIFHDFLFGTAKIGEKSKKIKKN